MLSTIFLKCCEIKFEASKQFVPSINKITKIINGMSLDSLFNEFLKNADDAGARRFSIYLDERILDKNFEKSTFLSKEMHNWQGPAFWIYYDKSFEKKDFFDHKNKIGRAGIIFSYYLTDILSFVSGKMQYSLILMHGCFHCKVIILKDLEKLNLIFLRINF